MPQPRPDSTVVPTLLDSWSPTTFAAAGSSHDVYRKGTGPGVIVIPEMPGPTPSVIGFAEEVVASGFTVVLPHLFGRIGAPMTLRETARSALQVCVSREFTKLTTGVTAPLADWLRALARTLHESTGGPGVGVVGMCFTGGFALATMVDPVVAAPVLAQPSMPAPIGARRKADLNLSPADLDAVKRRAGQGCPVLGLRYADDPMVGDRFETLRRELGTAFLAVEVPGAKHSTLTEHRDQHAVERVLAFFHERLDPSGASTP